MDIDHDGVITVDEMRMALEKRGVLDWNMVTLQAPTWWSRNLSR